MKKTYFARKRGSSLPSALSVAGVLLFIGATTVSVSAATFTVDNSGDVTDGDFTAGNFTLREAIELGSV